ncbi:MAG: hypothetical protein P1U56_17380 [Saprospiraceae bacterium]|nr:hypothetical protein [Saprospiraceae bacterium]
MKHLYLVLFLVSSIHISAQNLQQIADAKAFDVSGSIGGNLGLYSVNGIEERTSPFQYGLSARLNFKVYGFSMPVYASIRDNSFAYGGSFSRFRINPTYKWIKLHLGDTYLNFNPYTLNGRTVNGYGVELTPGKLRFKFLKGKVEDLRSFVDSLQLGTTFVPTYSRDVTAIGIGFGSSSSYLDVYGVRSSDRLDSLNGEKVLEDFTRRSNTVLGSTFALRLGKGLSLRSNAGLSFQTDNLDSYGDNTIIGSNGITGNIVEGNISSNVVYAGDIGLNYAHKSFSLNGRVKYIQPYFQPLTVAFINSDIINYTIGGSTSFFKRKLNLMGSVGVQKNNLTGNKLSTSNNLITNLVANFRLTRSLSGSLNYSNFTQDFQARLIQINDLYTYAISSNVANAALRYTISKGSVAYKFGIRAGRNTFLTVDDSEEDLNAYDSWNSSFNVGFSNQDNDLQVNSAITYRKYNREVTNSANYGIRLNANKGFIENKLRINLRSGYILNDREGLREGTTFRNGIDFNYKLDKNSNAGVQLGHIKRSSTVRSDFSEIRLGSQYRYTF